MSADYYVSRSARLLKDFDRAGRPVRPELEMDYGEATAIAILDDARREFERVLPEIPYIGGSRNRWTSDLIESAQLLTLFRAMRARGMGAEDTARIVNRGMMRKMAAYPGALLRLVGRLQFTSVFLMSLRHQATQSQRRRYAGDFVANVVLGDGVEFDWGIDFTECAIMKFYQAQGALDFLPLVCRNDYLPSQAFGLGMVRTKTLAEGWDRCNPRLKRGRPTQWT